MRKSPKHVRREFERRGLSIAEWAREHGFNQRLVEYVLNGGAARRGESHDIAIALGLKDGIPRKAAIPRQISTAH